ncbi:MAG: carbohydrate kinase [Phycisphaerales bacterium]|nr:MAG: carbohydrate kinase [Phycisphaerales bacterium]
MNDVPLPVVIGLGELLWDCFGESRRPGGAPANVAYHAGQLGARGVICSRVGSDHLGDELIRYLHDRGLETDFVQRDPQHPTGTVTVDASQPHDPRYVIHENVAWDYLEPREDLLALAAQAEAVCYGTLAQRSPATRDTIATVLTHGADALKVYDVNLRPPWFNPQLTQASLGRCDVVKLNAEEVRQVAEMLSFPSSEPHDFAHTLFDRYDLRLVCVTRASDGVLAIAPDEHVDLPGKSIRVADTVGAGDSFTAALIHGLLNDWPLQRTVRFANEVGALVASRSGAMPALRAEFAFLALER